MRAPKRGGVPNHSERQNSKDIGILGQKFLYSKNI